MFATIAVHDPVPGDIEIQRYDHESEDGSVSKRTRVKLVSRVKGATTGGFAGIDIHGDTEALTNFVVVLLAKLVDMPTTIELEGVDGEYVLSQRKVVVPITQPGSRFRHDGPVQTIEITAEHMPDPLSPRHLDLQVPTGRQTLRATDETGPWADVKAGEMATVHVLGGKRYRVATDYVSDDGTVIAGTIVGMGVED